MCVHLGDSQSRPYDLCLAGDLAVRSYDMCLAGDLQSRPYDWGLRRAGEQLFIQHVQLVAMDFVMEIGYAEVLEQLIGTQVAALADGKVGDQIVAAVEF